MVRYSNVQASVVDITTDSPKATDRFLVDTNVWFWQAYSKATSLPNPPTHNQQFDYPDFIEEALNANSTLYRCELAFSELSHLIEKTEFEFFLRTNPRITNKEFRHNYSHKRYMVVQEIKTAWDTVKNISDSLEISVNESLTDLALTKMSTQQLDGYDYFFLEAMGQNQVTQVITDDGDYITVPGITVFTSNRTTIAAARSQNKLIISH